MGGSGEKKEEEEIVASAQTFRLRWMHNRRGVMMSHAVLRTVLHAADLRVGVWDLGTRFA